jgi:hypothetical protein
MIGAWPIFLMLEDCPTLFTSLAISRVQATGTTALSLFFQAPMNLSLSRSLSLSLSLSHVRLEELLQIPERNSFAILLVLLLLSN